VDLGKPWPAVGASHVQDGLADSSGVVVAEVPGHEGGNVGGEECLRVVLHLDSRGWEVPLYVASPVRSDDASQDRSSAVTGP
jgi:hypothetical protein